VCSSSSAEFASASRPAVSELVLQLKGRRQRVEPVLPLHAGSLHNQDRSWNRQVARYDELFLDPYSAGVDNPLWDSLTAIPDAPSKTAADLGCGTGPLLPYLIARFGKVIALDFAPAMLARARARLAPDRAARVSFLERPMHELDELAGQLDVAVAVNSLVMPDVRLIDRTLKSIRNSLKSGGMFMGIVPSIDAIAYHLMLVVDRMLDSGLEHHDAERLAALHIEKRQYDFALGHFRCRGLRQKFWQPFEVEHRLARAGFRDVALAKVRYPWDDSLAFGEELTAFPRSWDWFFRARS
jgi:SAM-dependent methyltransferase